MDNTICRGVHKPINPVPATNSMETQDHTEYEICDPVSNKRFVTFSRDEAVAYFDKEWIVMERRVTICKPSFFTLSEMYVSMIWNNNPEFKGF